MDKKTNDQQKKIVSMNSAIQNLKSMVAKNNKSNDDTSKTTIVYNKPEAETTTTTQNNVIAEKTTTRKRMSADIETKSANIDNTSADIQTVGINTAPDVTPAKKNNTKTTTIDSVEIKEAKAVSRENSSAIAKIHAIANNNTNSELVPQILEEDKEYDDIKKSKKYAWLAYILFFIPLLVNRKSKFVRLHANEGLEIFIFDLLATALILTDALIEFNGLHSIFGIICKLAGIGLFILTGITKIFQIVQVIRGKATQTPWFWKARMIK